MSEMKLSMTCAIYARYSTDLQREQSIEDQFRVAARIAERHGFVVAAQFSDKAVSGGTTQRAGYQEMLGAARRNEFDVIVAEDTSRLWRNLAEQSPRLAELSDLGIAVVTHDLDTRHESAEIMGAVGGAMASAYRKEIGRRTRRGLEGLARAGKAAGGRSYGYVPAAMSGTNQIEIDPVQAAVVVRIFQLYADGYSPRAIAALLNRDNVPSPGSTWGRERRRKSGWVASAIHGEPARGSGMLNNDCYHGVVIWNRSRWVRSATDSSKRRYLLNPQAEWIVRKDERLRIVPEELWQSVKARQDSRANTIGERIKGGLSVAKAARTGAGPKYLLSSLMRCGQCGSSFVIAGRDLYKCSGHTNGGNSMCTNDAVVRRKEAEHELLAGIRRELLSPPAIEETCRLARAALSRPKPKASDNRARIAELKSQIGYITEAIASGMMRASPALGAKLRDAESDLEKLERIQAANDAPAPNVERLLPSLSARVVRLVEDLENTLTSGDVSRAREEIREHVGVVTVEADEHEIRLYSDKNHAAATFLRAAGGNAILCGSGGRI